MLDRSLDERTDYSRGFDRGNYGNAYKSQDWERWRDRFCADMDDRTSAYRAGVVLGFFSTYELHEIDDAGMRLLVKSLRKLWKA